MIVRLYEHVGTALIIPSSTGILYSNQAGGTACQTPQVEGFLVPIANDVGRSPGNRLYSPANQLLSYFEKGPSHGIPISEQAAQYIEAVFRQMSHWEGFSVDRSRLSESVEAWVHVILDKVESDPLPVDGMKYPVRAILTWENSD